MKYSEINGDLIALALEGKFDVIAHGCNCFCTMKKGLAIKMAEVFGCNYYGLEQITEQVQVDYDEYETVPTENKGDINKLGQIEYHVKGIKNGKQYCGWDHKAKDIKELYIVNAYTQYEFRKGLRLDYDALTLCLRKINHTFSGKHVGLPQIGCGLAGGDWNKVKEIILKELKDCDVTIIIY